MTTNDDSDLRAAHVPLHITIGNIFVESTQVTDRVNVNGVSVDMTDSNGQMALPMISPVIAVGLNTGSLQTIILTMTQNGMTM